MGFTCDQMQSSLRHGRDMAVSTWLGLKAQVPSGHHDALKFTIQFILWVQRLSFVLIKITALGVRHKAAHHLHLIGSG